MKKMLYALCLLPGLVSAQQTEDALWALSLKAGVTDEIVSPTFSTNLSSNIQVIGSLKDTNGRALNVGLSREFSFSEKPRRMRLGAEYMQVKIEPVVTQIGKSMIPTPLDLTLEIALLEGGYRLFQSDERAFDIWGSVAVGIASFSNSGTVTINSCNCLENTNETDRVIRPSLEMVYKVTDSLRIGLEVSRYLLSEKGASDRYPRTKFGFNDFNALSATLRLNF